MVEPPEILMDIREEVMVSPKGGNPVSKASHFIKPVLSVSDKTPEFPSVCLPFKPVLLDCTFNGWRDPTDEWISWVEKLSKRYKLCWKKAGIYDAVMSSMYRVVKNEELVLGLAERWCCETNTFMFSWGEATVTLEDVFVLGGFSVLGNSVSGYNLNRQVDEVERQLMSVYEKLGRGASEVSQCGWMDHFLKRDGEIEHEAFLSFWLSRFVLPTFPYNSIVPKFFKIAACLAKGIEMAIAPVVLASIYKDLALVKSVMENVGKFDVLSDDVLMVTLWAPLQLVQVWAWERFPDFRPKPNDIDSGKPRIARWHNADKKEIGNVRPMLQSSGDSFEWRPYCKAVGNLTVPGFFSGEEQWVFMGENVAKDVKVMGHCLRASELVGLESIEQYNPHRVAMQFGFDQDLPCFVKRDLMGNGIPQKELEQLAWLSYADPIKDQILYVPSSSYEPCVTLRYLKWLREGALIRQAALEYIPARRRDSLRSRRLKPPKLLFAIDESDLSFKTRPIRSFYPELDVQCDVGIKSIGIGHDVPPGFTPMPSVSKKKPDDPLLPKSIGNDLDVPPGFTPKSSVAKRKTDVPHDLKRKKTVGHSPAFDVPPGFVPKSLGKDLDVPPGFNPIGVTPVKLDDARKLGSVPKPPVTVKKERMESIVDVQAMTSSTPHTAPKISGDVGPNNKKKSLNTAEDEVHPRETAQVVTHSSTSLDAKARIAQLQKIVAGLKKAN